MFKTLFSPNLKQKHKTKLSRHFSGDKDFTTHPIPPATKSLMHIEEGNFKSLAEQEGLLNHQHRPNSPHTKQNKGLQFKIKALPSTDTLPGKQKFFQGAKRNLARKTFNRNLNNKIKFNESIPGSGEKVKKEVDFDNMEESVDQVKELQEKIAQSYRKAARQDVQYLKSIETYRNRVTEVNMLSKADLISSNKASYEFRSEIRPCTSPYIQPLSFRSIHTTPVSPRAIMSQRQNFRKSEKIQINEVSSSGRPKPEEIQSIFDTRD